MLDIDGIPSHSDLAAVTPKTDRMIEGPVAVIECFQEIPCNPCADACPQGAIVIPANISARPQFDESKCNGCGICVTRCPGLAIFVVDLSFGENEALLKIPFEFCPLPEKEEMVETLDRSGKPVGKGRVVRVQIQANKTTVLWLAVPRKEAMVVRNIRRRKEETE